MPEEPGLIQPLDEIGSWRVLWGREEGSRFCPRVLLPSFDIKVFVRRVLDLWSLIVEVEEIIFYS